MMTVEHCMAGELYYQYWYWSEMSSVICIVVIVMFGRKIIRTTLAVVEKPHNTL